MKSALSSRRHFSAPINYLRLSVAAAFLGLAFTAGAATLSWSGASATSANWSDSDNWGFAGVPASGDTLIFASVQPRATNTNDIPGLILNQLRFVGVGGVWTLRGNAFTLTNHIEATNSSATSTIENNITLGRTNQIFNVGGSVLVLSGILSGTNGFVKTGAGTLTLGGSGENSYTGPTFVSSGLLQLNNSASHSIGASSLLFIGDGIGGADADVVRYINTLGNQISVGVPVVITNSGLLDLNTHTDDVGPLTMSGGDVTTGIGSLNLAGDITIQAASRSSTIAGKLLMETTGAKISVTQGSADYALILSASISDGGGGFKFVPGANTNSFSRLTGNNTFTGPLTIDGIVVDAEAPLALGATNGSTIVTNGGELFLYTVNITNETVVLAPNATLIAQNNCSWNGPVVLAGNGNIAGFDSTLFDINGAISGIGNLSVGTAGTIRFTGTQSNSFTGTLTNVLGLLLLNKSAYNGAVPGNLVNIGTTRLSQSEQIVDGADVLVTGAGTFDFASFYDTFNTLRGSGNVTFGTSGYLTIGFANGSSTFDGLMSGTGFVGGYTVGKVGNGTFTMTASNTFLNAIDILAGKVVVNGSQPQNPVWLDSSTAVIGGSGRVGTISGSGSISPGTSPGILTSSNVILSASSQFLVEITGPKPGAGGYDQLSVTGGVTLANATLYPVLAPTTPISLGQQFVIINNDGSDAVTNTFNGLPQGAGFSAGVYGFQISYTGNSGNDVVLTLTNVPAAQAGSTVISGNGNHSIDPNECTTIYLAVTNTSVLPMTGVSGTLSTTTPGVVVTQPNSAFTAVPVSGKGTNVTGFQISTLRAFTCGADINLQLALSTSLGSFTIPVVLHTGEPGSPIRVDNSTILGIPDTGTVYSTNTVVGFTGPLQKVTVALYLTHVLDSDVTVSLIAPDNTTVLLTTANGGGGANYGANCSPDSSRTIFDDDAPVSITAGSAPFVGTFRPQASLAAFLGNVGFAVNGNWRLQITDCCGGSLGALRCWSLFLSPVACAAGGSICQTCPGIFSGSLTNSDLVLSNRVFRNGVPSTCGIPKPFPGVSAGSYHYRTYSFTNSTPSDACVTISLDTLCGNPNVIQAVAYLGSFDTNNLAANYLGDIGSSPPTVTSFSVSVPANNVVVVVVCESTANVGCSDYNLVVNGLPCPPPTLAISKLTPPSNVNLRWPTTAGGYNLEATPAVSPTDWTLVTNEPIVTGTNYSVTNTTTPNSRFYRLHKP